MSIPQLSEQDLIEILQLAVRGVNASTDKPGHKQLSLTVKAQAGRFILKLYTDSGHRANSVRAFTALLPATGFFVVCRSGSRTSFVRSILKSTEMTHRGECFDSFDSRSVGERQNFCHARAAVEHLRVTCALAGFDPEGQLAQLPSWAISTRFILSCQSPWKCHKRLHLLQSSKHASSKLQKSSKPCPICIKRFQFKPFTDYLSFNILLSENQVVGVFDFEFATRDLRLVDYICASMTMLFPWKEALVGICGLSGAGMPNTFRLSNRQER